MNAMLHVLKRFLALKSHDKSHILLTEAISEGK